jgi:hypothetical protein
VITCFIIIIAVVSLADQSLRQDHHPGSPSQRQDRECQRQDSEQGKSIFEHFRTNSFNSGNNPTGPVDLNQRIEDLNQRNEDLERENQQLRQQQRNRVSFYG